jgi:hypothetical protein
MAGVKASWAISSHCIACLQTSRRMYAAKLSCSGKDDVAVAGWDCGYFLRGVGAGRSERRKAAWAGDMEFCDRTNGRLTGRRKEPLCAFWRLSHGCSLPDSDLREWGGDRGQFRTCKDLVRSLAVGGRWPGLTFGTPCTSAAAGPEACPSRIEPASVF